MIEQLQRTSAWFEARKGRVTASKVGAILGLDPHRNRDDVMRAMVRETLGEEREFTGNVATEWGTQMETEALAHFELETGLEVAPAPFVPCEDWAGASPDGYIDESTLLEIKCPYSRRDATSADDFLSIDEQPHYEAQIQMQLYATGRDKCYFFQFAPGATRLEVVEKRYSWLVQEMNLLRDFYADYLKELKKPEKHLAPLVQQITTPEALELLRKYDVLQEIQKGAKDQAEKIKARLIELAGGENAEIDGRKLTKVERKGSISYAKVVKEHLKGVDLEPYRGKSSEYWRLG